MTHLKQLLCCKRKLVGCIRWSCCSLIGCQRLPELRDLVQALHRAIHVAGVPQIAQACMQSDETLSSFAG